MKNKKGVSAVIATVLLIMITIAAVALIAGIIIPFVKNQMEKGKSCFEATDQLSIVQGKYTCYNSESTSIMISRNSNPDFSLKTIIISLTKDDGSAEVYKISNGIITPGVKMYNGTSALEIPKSGGAETYVFNVKSSYVSIAPLLSNEISCKESSENIEPC